MLTKTNVLRFGSAPFPSRAVRLFRALRLGVESWKPGQESHSHLVSAIPRTDDKVVRWQIKASFKEHFLDVPESAVPW